MALLEKAFAAEIAGALTKSPRLMQTRSKLAEELVTEGLLEKVSERFGGGIFGVTLEGYKLTHAGRLLYCASCDG